MSYLLAPSVATGAGVFAINLYNKNLSPIYNKKFKEEENMKDLKFFCATIFKGNIYGFFWPFALFGIITDIYSNNKNFQNHFITFSKHGGYENN